MKKLILVLTKGPHRRRFGPERFFDWKVSCRKALALQRVCPDSKIYVPSAVAFAGELPEWQYYASEFIEIGLRHNIHASTTGHWCLCEKDDMGTVVAVVEQSGYETIGFIALGRQFAKREGARLAVVSTATYFPRVLYLCRGKQVEHHVAWGIPNIVEATTDCLLAIAFPVLDILGLAERFQKWVIRRRSNPRS